MNETVQIEEIQEKQNVNQNIQIEEIKEEQDTNQMIQTEEGKEEQIWEIEIPSINLDAMIEEGTTEEIMEKYVGHFENTSKWEGNIGLAAHNRRISN